METILDYLKINQPKGGSINIPALLELKIERSSWLDYPINKKFKDFFVENNIQFKSEHQLFDQGSVEIGKADELDGADLEKIIGYAKDFIPWRKGPFKLFGEEIDAEWRSDFKWERVAQKLELKQLLENKRVLDIGCNNGYFMFRMLEHNPAMVLGIDPVLRNLAQFMLMQSFVQSDKLFFELFGIEHLTYFENYFDTIFSMGILYHHKSPLDQLQQMRKSLCTGGSLILETIIWPGDEPIAFTPEDRYAKMKNVYFLPTVKCLTNWLKKTRFQEIEVIDVSPTSLDEQRNTAYCPRPQETLVDFLDPKDQSLTIEGYPAPQRVVMHARKLPERPKLQ